MCKEIKIKVQTGTITFKPTKNPSPKKKQPFTKYLNYMAKHTFPKKNILGSKFKDILPTQGVVFQGAVEAKIKQLKKKKETFKIGVFYVKSDLKKQLYMLGDGHHSICAAIATGSPLELYLYEKSRVAGVIGKDWSKSKRDGMPKTDLSNIAMFKK